MWTATAAVRSGAICLLTRSQLLSLSHLFGPAPSHTFVSLSHLCCIMPAPALPLGQRSSISSLVPSSLERDRARDKGEGMVPGSFQGGSCIVCNPVYWAICVSVLYNTYFDWPWLILYRIYVKYLTDRIPFSLRTFRQWRTRLELG